VFSVGVFFLIVVVSVCAFDDRFARAKNRINKYFSFIIEFILDKRKTLSFVTSNLALFLNKMTQKCKKF
jgi:hypothetical protein